MIITCVVETCSDSSLSVSSLDDVSDDETSVLLSESLDETDRDCWTCRLGCAAWCMTVGGWDWRCCSCWIVASNAAVNAGLLLLLTCWMTFVGNLSITTGSG